MENINWLKQQPNDPLYPDILWSRPENKQSAGKLLIVGGSSQAFHDVARAYSDAEKAGAGTVRVIIPDKLGKMIGKFIPEAILAPSTPSGSFSREALAAILAEAVWADALLLAGNFGRNSETAIFIESLIDKFNRTILIAGDSLDYLISAPGNYVNKDNLVIAPTFSQLQKLGHGRAAFRHDMDLSSFVNELGKYTSNDKLLVVTEFANNVVVGFSGNVATTKSLRDFAETTTRAVVFSMQNPNKIFEAIVSSLLA